MKSEGIISPIDSSYWGTPIVTVLKSNGKVRICGDYRQVNKHLVDVVFPISTIDAIFSKLNKGERFTKIDLSQAYNQFELDEESKNILVLNTTKGLYKINRMPFGISSASALCQKFISQLFTGMEGVVNFQDDLLVTANDDESHLQNLEKVLTKLEEAGLTVELSQCAFFQDKVEYLGFEISKHGLSKLDDKIKAICLAPPPQNVSELRSFLGMVNYYSKFVPHIATILKPLYDLLKKTVKFQWSDECNNVFNKIKELISKDITLMHYNPNVPLILTT